MQIRVSGSRTLGDRQRLESRAWKQQNNMDDLRKTDTSAAGLMRKMKTGVWAGGDVRISENIVGKGAED